MGWHIDRSGATVTEFGGGQVRLLRRMMDIQLREGAVVDEELQRLADEENVPLHRLQGLRSFYPVFREQAIPGKELLVCRDLLCRMSVNGDPVDVAREHLDGVRGVEITGCSCLGLCDRAPAAMVDHLPVAGSADLLRQAVAEPEAVHSDGVGPACTSWPTDPYVQSGERYGTLRRVIAEWSADDVIDALKAADLKGLGGAAFPTGVKWGFTRRAQGDEKFVVCNADESEPGTFKDRVILEQLPWLVIEGLLLGAWVVGARRGVIYLRHEYVAARKALESAMQDAYDRGVLGPDAFGRGWSFDLELFVSPGGYVMGEETALLEALEDKRGEPRNKPPFPTNHGLQGQPTLINNVETLAAVPAICRFGPEWWRQQGVNGYSGLKFVSVSGDVVKPGVYCVPWGIRVRDLLSLCGGVPEGASLLAFSPGGASTSFLSADKLDTPMDFYALEEAGSGLGTGAVVFVADGRSMLDVALAQVRFFRNESCGKCVPCRIGSQKAVEFVEKLMNGEPGLSVMSLPELHETLSKTSICGLGQVALQPLVDALETFQAEPSIGQLREKLV